MANNCCSQEPHTGSLPLGGQSGADGEGSREGDLVGWRLQPRQHPPPTVPSPHMEGNESAGTGLFLLGFPVWVSLLLPFERAGSVRGCGKQLQEPESNPLGMGGGGGASKCAHSFGIASASLPQSFVQKELWGPLRKGRRREGPSWADPPGAHFTPSHPTPMVCAHAHTELQSVQRPEE